MKKIRNFALVMLLAMVSILNAGATLPAQAAEGAKATEVEVPAEIFEGISAYEEDAYGNKIPLECEVTLKKYEPTTRSAGTKYELTVQASEQKTSTGESSNGGVKAFGTIVWIDNFGLGNEFVSVSGSWTNTSEIAYRMYNYGGVSYWYGDSGFATNSFFDNRGRGETARSFKLYTYARLHSGKVVSLDVKTSIFD